MLKWRRSGGKTSNSQRSTLNIEFEDEDEDEDEKEEEHRTLNIQLRRRGSTALPR